VSLIINNYVRPGLFLTVEQDFCEGWADSQRSTGHGADSLQPVGGQLALLAWPAEA
jgi:hypothetical protein